MLTREGIVRLLEEAGIEVVGQVEDGDAVVRKVAATKADVAIIDIRMPPTHTDEGLVAAQRIRADHPAVGVLVLSQYVEPTYALRLLEEHPEKVGYLLKERIFDVAVLIDALRRIAEGETVIDPTIVSRLVGRRRREDPLAELTPREREVLSLVAEGMSNRAIAAGLHRDRAHGRGAQQADLPQARPRRVARPAPARARRAGLPPCGLGGFDACPDRAGTHATVARIPERHGGAARAGAGPRQAPGEADVPVSGDPNGEARGPVTRPQGHGDMPRDAAADRSADVDASVSEDRPDDPQPRRDPCTRFPGAGRRLRRDGRCGLRRRRTGSRRLVSGPVAGRRRGGRRRDGLVRHEANDRVGIVCAGIRGPAAFEHGALVAERVQGADAEHVRPRLEAGERERRVAVLPVRLVEAAPERGGLGRAEGRTGGRPSGSPRAGPRRCGRRDRCGR